MRQVRLVTFSDRPPPPISACWLLAPPTGFLCWLCTQCFNLHMAGGGCSGLLSSAPTADWQGLLPLSMFQGWLWAAVEVTLWCSGQHCPPGTRICGLLPSCVFILKEDVALRFLFSFR